MIIPPGFAQVNLVFTGAGVPRGAQVAYGVILTSQVVTYTPNSLATFAGNAWQDSVLTLQNNQVRLTQVRTKFGPNATGGDGSATFDVAGGQAAGSDAPQVAVLVRKKTPFGGRKGRGRMFVPGVTETGTSAGGLLVDTDFNGFQTQFDAWLLDHDQGGVPVHLLHTEVGLAPYVVEDMEVQRLVATQRRRLRKVGGRRSIP
jgi:hypothetical protein